MLNNLREYLNDPKYIKRLALSGLLIFSGGVLFCIIIAAIFGKEGYDLTKNFMSDLGSIQYSPIPIFFDFVLIISQACLIPVFFYLKKKIIDAEHSKSKKGSIARFLANLGSYILILGSTALIIDGIFSFDRTTLLNIHFYSTIIAFVGWLIGAFLIGLGLFFSTESYLPKSLRIYMFVSLPFSITCLFLRPSSLSLQALKWLLFIGIYFWAIPYILQVFNKQINKQKKGFYCL